MVIKSVIEGRAWDKINKAAKKANNADELTKLLKDLEDDAAMNSEKIRTQTIEEETEKITERVRKELTENLKAEIVTQVSNKFAVALTAITKILGALKSEIRTERAKRMT